MELELQLASAFRHRAHTAAFVGGPALDAPPIRIDRTEKRRDTYRLEDVLEELAVNFQATAKITRPVEHVCESDFRCAQPLVKNGIGAASLLVSASTRIEPSGGRRGP